MSGYMEVAVSGSYLFELGQNGTLGEYTTSGALVNASLITGLGNDVYSMVVDGSNLFLVHRSGGTVAEYTLGSTPGTVISADTSFITGLYDPMGLAIESSPTVGPTAVPETTTVISGLMLLPFAACTVLRFLRRRQ